MSTHPHILCIETSSGITSVALSAGENSVAQKVEYTKNSAGSQLQNLIEGVLLQADIDFKELDAIAVSGGPGSYTGLRIGVSVAKGMAYALNIPLVLVETFQAMKKQLELKNKNQYDFYIPMIDARRIDAFTCILNQKGEFVLTPRCLTIESHTFDEWLSKNQNVIVFGNEIDKFREIVENKIRKFDGNVTLFAESMIPNAVDKFKKGRFEDVAYVEPKYYKSFYTAKI